MARRSNRQLLQRLRLLHFHRPFSFINMHVPRTRRSRVRRNNAVELGADLWQNLLHMANEQEQEQGAPHEGWDNLQLLANVGDQVQGGEDLEQEALDNLQLIANVGDQVQGGGDLDEEAPENLQLIANVGDQVQGGGDLEQEALDSLQLKANVGDQVQVIANVGDLVQVPHEAPEEDLKAQITQFCEKSNEVHVLQKLLNKSTDKMQQLSESLHVSVVAKYNEECDRVRIFQKVLDESTEEMVSLKDLLLAAKPDLIWSSKPFEISELQSRGFVVTDYRN